jgi:hypothetical protein
MKSFKNLIIPFVILFCIFAVVAAEEEEDSGIGEIIGDIIAFIIGDIVGSCLVKPECAVFLGPIILYMVIGIILSTIILQCCCGIKFDDDHYLSSNRRTGMFAAGMGLGALRNR